MSASRKKGYPKLTLTGAIKVVKKAYGVKSPMSKETFANFGAKKGSTASTNSGAFTNKISSLRSYGLITTDKNSVSLTPLVAKIIDPLGETEKVQAVKESFFNVEVFKELYENLQKNIPLDKETLEASAANDIGISRSERTKFVNNFIDAGQIAELVELSDGSVILRGEKESESLKKNNSDTITIEGEQYDSPEDNAVNIGSKKATHTFEYEHVVKHEWRGVNDAWNIELSIYSEKLPQDFYIKIADIMHSIDSLKKTLDKYEA